MPGRRAPQGPAQLAAPADGREEKLLGRRVLVVEDETFVAMELQFAFEDAGAEVIGPCLSLADALATLKREAEIDYAVLDVDIAGQAVYPVAEALTARGVPFLFHTGHGSRRQHAARFPDAVTCLKPTLPEVLIDTLLTLRRG